MQSNDIHGLIRGLTAAARTDIQQLTGICNNFEGLDLPIYLDSATSDADFFSFYEHGQLIGFAYIPGESEPEVCGMVHPDHRRRGIGRRLLDAIRTEYRRRGTPELLLVCEAASASGQAFVTGAGGKLRISEHRMQLDPTAVDRSHSRQDGLDLQPAGSDDAETLIHIQATAFGDPEEEVRPFVRQSLQDTNRRYYIGTLNGSPIGIIRLSVYEPAADITAFGVLPEYRGRGYGRQMLLGSIDILLAEGHDPIQIEVVTENQNALGLYRSCGFKVTTTYGFYELTTDTI